MAFKIDQKVKTNANVKPKKFAKQTGTVVSVRSSIGEIGVWFGNYDDDGNSITTWFKPTELALQIP